MYYTFAYYQCLKTPLIIKKQVIKFTPTTIVLIIATLSASKESSDAFSPRLIAHNFQ